MHNLFILFYMFFASFSPSRACLSMTTSYTYFRFINPANKFQGFAPLNVRLWFSYRRARSKKTRHILVRWCAHSATSSCSKYHPAQKYWAESFSIQQRHQVTRVSLISCVWKLFAPLLLLRLLLYVCSLAWHAEVVAMPLEDLVLWNQCMRSLFVSSVYGVTSTRSVEFCFISVFRSELWVWTDNRQ